jgi:hypothetical protein
MYPSSICSLCARGGHSTLFHEPLHPQMLQMNGICIHHMSILLPSSSWQHTVFHEPLLSQQYQMNKRWTLCMSIFQSFYYDTFQPFYYDSTHDHHLFSFDALTLVCSTWLPQHNLIVLHFLRASEADDVCLSCHDSAQAQDLFSSDALTLVCSTWPHQHDPIVLHFLQASEAKDIHLNCFVYAQGHLHVSLHDTTSKGNLLFYLHPPPLQIRSSSS